MTTTNNNDKIVKWTAYPTFQISQFRDQTIEGMPYKLIFGSFPVYPVQIGSITFDFTGSILDHSCLDPKDSNYMFPLFYRIIVLLNTGNDVYFDTTFSYTPRLGNEWTGLKTFTLSKMLPYTRPTDSIVILLYPTSCTTNVPYIRTVEFTPFSPTTAPPLPPTPVSPSISHTISAFKKYWYIFLILGIVILFLIMVILSLTFHQQPVKKNKSICASPPV